MERSPRDHKRSALQLILLFGVVSLFGDIAYESARSINGPYLKILAANAAVVGIVAGLGEFLGYALRLVSGYLSDRTKAYWTFTFLGYGMLAAVPLLSLANGWQMAALFIVAERAGKALRSPARDSILSHAGSQVGTGFSFGLHEAMDQIGAIAGPLVLAFFFARAAGTGDIGIAEYQRAYSFLWLPVVLVMASLIFAYVKSPDPVGLEDGAEKDDKTDKLSKAFWLYTAFMFVSTLGFVNFVLISFHFKKTAAFSDAQIPFFYAVAMAVDAAAALAVGRIYDELKRKRRDEKGGLEVLAIIPLLSLVMPILAFCADRLFSVAGVCIWGLIMGIHETIMRSAIADITPLKRRGTGYGIFNAGYGLAMFLGSVLMGLLYGYSLYMLIAAVAVIELVATALFLVMRREIMTAYPVRKAG